MTGFAFRGDDGLSMFQPEAYREPATADMNGNDVTIGFEVGTRERSGSRTSALVYVQSNADRINVVSDPYDGHATVPTAALDELIEALQAIRDAREG